MIQFRPENFDLETIAKSGQCFRMTRIPGGYELVAAGRFLRAFQDADGFCTFECAPSDFAGFWRDYFDLSEDYGRFLRAMPEDDPFLREAARLGRGIRILRQEPFETLITFIISQRRSIPSIARAVRALCAHFGEEIAGAPAGTKAFPTPEALASQTEETLLPCALGYRAKYVLEAARRVATGATDLPALGDLPDEALCEALLGFFGVGPKVAACVMLFGFHRLSAFPRDVWINRALETRYPSGFELARFSGFEGVVQQYIFYCERMEIGKLTSLIIKP